MVTQDVQEFLCAVEETPHLWRSVDARVLALYADGAWHNMVARFRLSPLPQADVSRLTGVPRLERLAVLQNVHTAEDLPSLIAAVSRGELEIGGEAIRFLVGDGTETFVKPYSQSYHQIGSDISDAVRGRCKYGHSITLSGDYASELYRTLPRGEEGLNAALRGLPEPWGGVGDVLLHALDEKLSLRGHDLRRVSFVAPLEARLSKDDCILVAEGVLTYAVEATSKDTAKACVLVITGIDAGGQRISHRVPLSGKRWAKTRGGYRYTGTERFRGAKHLRLTLRLASFELGYVELDARSETPPLLLSAYHALFPGERNFEQSLLQPVRTQARTFENQVALLFTYCGMPAEYIGGGSDKEAPDLLVELPRMSVVLVVEITVGPLNHQGKLARLTKRAEQVRDQVERASDRVLPVIVTSNARSAIAQNELDAAKADGIRVISQDDLIILWAMATRRAPIRHVAKYLAPHLVSGPTPPLWGLRELHKHVMDDDTE